MSTSSGTLKSASLNEIESAIAQALSQYTEFPSDVEIRAFEMIKGSAIDALTQEIFRLELKVSVPRHDPSKRIFDFD